MTSVPVREIVPLTSLPEMVLVVPHEETTGFCPEVTTCPVVSISKEGNPTVAVVEPTEKFALVEYVLPTPRKGLVAVVSTLKTSIPAAFLIVSAFATFVAVLISKPPIPVSAFEIAAVHELEPYVVVVVAIPIVALGVMKSVEVPTAVFVPEKYASWPVVPSSRFCLPLKVVQSVEVKSPLVEPLAFKKREDVAIAVGTAEAPVILPSTELAAIAASPIVPVVVIVPPVRPLLVAIEVTVPDPPLGVVVAINLPFGSKAAKEPAGTPQCETVRSAPPVMN